MFSKNKTPPISREQMWREIKEGKRKKSFFFEYSQTALAFGILAVLGVASLTIITGLISLYCAEKSLKDPVENKIRKNILQAKWGQALAIVGLILNVGIRTLLNP